MSAVRTSPMMSLNGKVALARKSDPSGGTGVRNGWRRIVSNCKVNHDKSCLNACPRILELNFQ